MFGFAAYLSLSVTAREIQIWAAGGVLGGGEVA